MCGFFHGFIFVIASLHVCFFKKRTAIPKINQFKWISSDLNEKQTTFGEEKKYENCVCSFFVCPHRIMQMHRFGKKLFLFKNKIY